jgi:hypothetical protein
VHTTADESVCPFLIQMPVVLAYCAVRQKMSVPA